MKVAKSSFGFLADGSPVSLYTLTADNGSVVEVLDHGAVYERRHGLCLETQHYPDSVHHSQWPSTVLRAGETFRSWTRYRFGVE